MVIAAVIICITNSGTSRRKEGLSGSDGFTDGDGAGVHAFSLLSDMHGSSLLFPSPTPFSSPIRRCV